MHQNEADLVFCSAKLLKVTYVNMLDVKVDKSLPGRVDGEVETVLGDGEADVEPLEEELAEGVLLVHLGLQEGARSARRSWR